VVRCASDQDEIGPQSPRRLHVRKWCCHLASKCRFIDVASLRGAKIFPILRISNWCCVTVLLK
jgi:hypothetical protein